jgi:hypothetical protein
MSGHRIPYGAYKICRTIEWHICEICIKKEAPIVAAKMVRATFCEDIFAGPLLTNRAAAPVS